MSPSVVSKHAAPVAWVVLFMATLLAGCPFQEATSPTTPTSSDAPEGPTSTDAPAVEGDAALTDVPSFADLKPTVRVDSRFGSAPRSVSVLFREELQTEVSLGEVVTPEQLVLDFNPPVEGDWTWETNRRVTFHPHTGFLPGTPYALELASLAIRGEEVDVSASEKAIGRVDTPGFAFNRVFVVGNDAHSKTVDLELAFTGPVDQATARAKVQFRIGATRPKVTWLSTDEADRVRARISSSVLVGDQIIAISATSGIKSHLAPITAEAIDESVTVNMGGSELEILAVSLREGNGNRYIDVVCNDPEVDGWERYYWDEEAGHSYWISPRCELDAQALQGFVHVDPKVPVRVTPSRGGFRLQGPFERGNLTVRIDPGAASVDGAIVKKAVEERFEVEPLTPSTGFLTQGRYLPRDAWASLPVRHTNADEIQLTIRHINRSNLIFWMSDANETGTERNSDVVVDTTIPVRGDVDIDTTTWIDLASLVPEPEQGVYELTVSVDGGNSDVRRVLMTDMNLVAKASAVPIAGNWPSTIDTWAIDVHGNTPMYGVTVKAIRKSGHILATCSTDSEGHCALDFPQDDVDPAKPFALVASLSDDITYLKFEELRVAISEDKVQGEHYLTKTAYRASVYSDRGVYRPGDTAHVAGVIRGRDNLAPPQSVPLVLELLDPRNQVVKRQSTATNDAGMFVWELPFEDYASTGAWQTVVKAGDDTLSTYTFAVEEFVPERMAVTAEMDRDGYRNTEKVPVKISAKYLFGGSASGSNVELRCRIEPTTFSPAENAQLHYGSNFAERKPPSPVDLGLVNGSLDDNGESVLHCPTLDEAGGFATAGRLVADVAVFEAGSGRTTNQRATAPVHPADFYVGIDSARSKLKKGESAPFTGAVVGWDGALHASVSTVSAQLYHLEEEWDWWWDEWDDEESYRRMLRPVPQGNPIQVQVNGGKFRFELAPEVDAVGYLVEVQAGAVTTQLQLGGHGGRYWWSSAETAVDQTPRPAKPTSVSLSLPDEIEVGTPTSLQFTAPYRGRALVTIETHKLLSHTWLHVEPGPVEWGFTVDVFDPNVYASVLVLKDPHLESAEVRMPDRAFGVASAEISPAAFTTEVSIKVPESVRSNSTLDVEIQVSNGDQPTFVTVAAVDEGILSLTRFPSPDPTGDLFPMKALGVETFETVGWSMQVPPAGSSSSTGGGSGDGPPKRITGVKPVALWSGLVAVENGKATVSFEIPQYRGALRVMAVAASAERFGHADATVVVKDPLVVQTTLPRFFIEGDQADVPVFVTNMSGEKREIDVALSVSNIPQPGVPAPADGTSMLSFVGANTDHFTLDDGEAKTLVFRVQANVLVGAAKLEVVAKSGKLVSTDSLDVPFAPNRPKVRTNERITLVAGDLNLLEHMDGWIPTTEQSRFWVTANPYGQALSHLKYLIRYPYGCIEQTTSSTRPLLFVGKLLPAIDPEIADQDKIDDMVMSGVKRIISMQTPSGGFSYWPGGNDPTYWGTAYATHMLIDAREQGYDIADEVIDDATGYMLDQIDLNRNENQHGYRNFRYSEPYFHYVLARAGKARKGRILTLVGQLANTTDGADLEAVYLLKASLFLAGDRRYEADLRSPDISPVKTDRRNNWWFYSDLRRRAFTLTVHQDLFGTDPSGEPLAQLVAARLGRSNSRWYSTQEIVWGVTGLGKRVLDSSSNFKEPILKGNGRGIDGIAPIAGTSDRTWQIARASEYASLTLNIPDTGDGKVYLLIDSEGSREDTPWKMGGNRLSLTRTYFDAEGNLINPGEMTLGDLVYTKISIKNTGDTPVENIAMVDRFAAGWEIENPRLGRGGSVDFLDSDAQWDPDYMNLRDDRLEVFGKLDAGQTREVVYALRAVTAGTFTSPPVEAEAMYDSEIWARAPGVKVVINGDWDDFYL